MKEKSKAADHVLRSLRSVVLPWRSERGIPTNAFTGNPYNGINLLVLDAVASQRKYRSKYWGTYQQWESLSFHVEARPADVENGNWGTAIFNWKPHHKVIDKGSIISIEHFNLMQKHTVFNTEQVFGRNLGPFLVTTNERRDYTEAEKIIEATGVTVVEASHNYYDFAKEEIGLLPKQEFVSESQYFATKLHELFHFAETRTGWNKASAAQGELIAEIGTGYLESILGLPHDSDMTNCNLWLNEWIDEIEKSPKYLFDAAAQVSRSIDFILQKKSSV